jgi:hypothetical protein
MVLGLERIVLARISLREKCGPAMHTRLTSAVEKVVEEKYASRALSTEAVENFWIRRA